VAVRADGQIEVGLDDLYPPTSARSRCATTREAFGVGIAMSVEKPSPTSRRSNSGQRAAVVVPLSTK
jgi:hypothetical protein